jgi:hypothetical protein
MKNLFLLLSFTPFAVFAQFTQGPNNPTASQNTLCPFAYSSPVGYSSGSNAFASDNSYATASHCDCCDMNTQCFETTGYGFTIPGTATIDGILVEVEKKATVNSMVQDNGVKLLKAGNVTGLSYAASANWPAADTYISYGGASDLWGASWTPADINDPNFGLAFASISYTCNGNGVPMISSIDHIRITIYYTDVTGANEYSASANNVLIAPNPAENGRMNITIPENEKEVTLSLSDLAGRTVFTGKYGRSGPTLEVVLPKDLPAGTYLVKLSGTRDHFGKLVVN